MKDSNKSKKMSASKLIGVLVAMAVLGLSLGDALTAHGIKGNKNLNPIVVGDGSGSGSGTGSGTGSGSFFGCFTPRTDVSANEFYIFKTFICDDNGFMPLCVYGHEISEKINGDWYVISNKKYTVFCY